MSERCPWCGAEHVADTVLSGVWICGSIKLTRSMECYKLQLARMQPAYDAACEYEEQWHSNPNLQPYLHKLRVAVVKSKDTNDA